ncbi:MAG: hypothetical protein FWH56_04695 [Betaproteobacteria bacterium]|nr:hypothetical protein [Betaproteobacteria bacterium]
MKMKDGEMLEVGTAVAMFHQIERGLRYIENIGFIFSLPDEGHPYVTILQSPYPDGSVILAAIDDDLVDKFFLIMLR